jgi:NADH-quinone oxidoreductase subunit N
VAAAGLDDLDQAFYATVAYLLIYAVMNLGAFGAVIAVMARLRSADLRDWGGLGTYAAGLATVTTIFFFSLAGIPPLAGWFAKLAMFQALISVDNGWGYSMAVIAALNSVVALVYYAKVVKVVWMDPVPESVDVDAVERRPVVPSLRLAVGISAVAVVVLGVFPGLIANLSEFTTTLFAAP